jgi:hypothetical protein
MDQTRAARLTLILSIIAAALAFAAAVARYLKNGEVNISLIAASIFIFAFGLAARGRIKQ